MACEILPTSVKGKYVLKLLELCRMEESCKALRMSARLVDAGVNAPYVSWRL